MGGAGAFAGALILGPRIGRFKNGRVLPIAGHSVVLIMLGFFILWFGFFAFNGGSEGGIVGKKFDPVSVARAVVNTSISGSSAFILSLVLLKIGLRKEEVKLFGKEFHIFNVFGGYWSISASVNGGLTGMVAICAGCNVVEPWAAFVIGIIACK